MSSPVRFRRHGRLYVGVLRSFRSRYKAEPETNNNHFVRLLFYRKHIIVLLLQICRLLRRVRNRSCILKFHGSSAQIQLFPLASVGSMLGLDEFGSNGYAELNAEIISSRAHFRVKCWQSDCLETVFRPVLRCQVHNFKPDLRR